MALLIIIYLAVTSGATSATQNNSTECGRYLNDNPDFLSGATFNFRSADDYVFTDGVLSDSLVASKVDCGRRCLSGQECVMFTFQRSTAGKRQGACRLYGKVHSAADVEKEARPGARSYVMNTAAFRRVHNGYSMQSGYCVRLVNETMTYQDARQRCQALDGGHVFFTKTLDSITFAHDILTQYGLLHLWIGASDQENEGDFRWEDGTALPVGSPLWATNQPDNQGDQDCVGLWHHTDLLDDAWCADADNIHLLCQRDV